MTRQIQIGAYIILNVALLWSSSSMVFAQVDDVESRNRSSTDAESKRCEVSPEAIDSAIRRSLRLLEKASAGAVEHRKCYTCHHQALPVLVFVEARKRGFTIDEENLKRQIKQTVKYVAPRRTAIAYGYALWALDAGGWKADETTNDLTDYLLATQKQSSHWRGEPLNKNRQIRPPAAGSDFTTTYLALRGLTTFGNEKQMPKIDQRRKSVRQWLLLASPEHTEDHAFRLRLLKHLNADKATIQKATTELIQLQRKDGGWAQRADMKSDAYATGNALNAILRASNSPSVDSAVSSAVQYLIDTQHEDGSWHVTTRAKPVQPYFESGFPHGKDQFISTFASNWATLALLRLKTR